MIRTDRPALRAWLIQQADAYAQQPSANVPLIQGTLARARARWPCIASPLRCSHRGAARFQALPIQC
jgi:hypothetical protein